MPEIKLTSRAYSKIILHAAKYPHCSISGVLLAKHLKGSKEEQKNRNLVILDAIPMFHLCLHVTPMTEIALTQIDAYCQTSGLVIAGYYLANENNKDLSYDKPCHRIAEKIADNFPGACLIVVDNQKLSLSMENMALIIYQNIDNKWKLKDKSSVSLEKSSTTVVAGLLERKVQKAIVDFDNHLDNISLDWRNLTLNNEIEEELGTVIE